MTVMNGLDRFHLALAIIDRAPRIKKTETARRFAKSLEAKLAEHHDYICAKGEDMPEVQQWRWTQLG